MSLIIVESPTKSKTLQGFLGSKYKVLSSFGHIRDLPKSELGIDTENNFAPKYIIPTKARKAVKALKDAAKKEKSIILATDEDREGEAIAWHLAELLDLNKKENYQRIVFHEITKPAIEEALKNPRKIDINLVDAQQARRVLDRLVGYKLSPFLWKKIARGLSAGRVQSAAVRLVVAREKEIEKFIPQEYWSVTVLLSKGKEFEAFLIKEGDKTLDKLEIKNEQEAKKILNDLTEAQYKVANVEKKENKKNPLPPFTTSTLQQDAWKKFHFPAKMTMRIAQALYERGLITYHRTDSLNLSDLALFAAKDFITQNYGQNYWAGFPRKYKAKGKVQEAHEAIRPTYADKNPDDLKDDELDNKHLKLYGLIWRRFIACQMAQAVFDATAIDVQAKNYLFRANGSLVKFDGFLKVYQMKFEETELPDLTSGDILKLIKITPEQHFTQPPGRFTEATLIKALESEGIGRPSTYAPIISTIQDRNYIEKNENKYFKPTEIGLAVDSLLVAHFPKIVDIKFTANMEEEFDKIAQGKRDWTEALKEFYTPFAKNLAEKYQEVSKKEFTEEAAPKECPKCGAKLLVKLGRFGKFYACSRFPECKHTESLKKAGISVHCPKCQEGELTEKRTKKGKIFYGCNKFPECSFALWDKPTGDICPQCRSLLITSKKGKIKCSNKECEYVRETPTTPKE